MATPTLIWRLNHGADRRVRAGHPWVYSNELQKSPKGIVPGQKVGLADAGGKFIAWGHGNPSSLIAFRVLSRIESEEDCGTPEWFKNKLEQAWDFRKSLGLETQSFRWVHGEGDGLSGLIIDRYVTPATNVIVVQAHTAGMNLMLSSILEAIDSIMKSRAPNPDWGLVIRNDVSSRKLEGIEVEEPKVHRKWKGMESAHQILVRGIARKTTPFDVDLIQGQKTGFFLDQAENIIQVGEILARSELPKTFKILDLCPYVGQWSAKLAQSLKEKGIQVEVTLLDASHDALSLAHANVQRTGARVTAIQGDVLEDLKQIGDRSFDLVISDPPAFIKGRKDIPQGTAAYLKLNTEVFRVVSRQGFVVACSCSQLLEEEELMKLLAKAAKRQSRECRWIARGTQAVDHPVRLEFGEGKYLKMWFGKVGNES